MDLLQVDRLAASITFGNHQILLHMTLIPVSVSVVVQAWLGLYSLKQPARPGQWL
jgi:hypothetical protein